MGSCIKEKRNTVSLKNAGFVGFRFSCYVVSSYVWVRDQSQGNEAGIYLDVVWQGGREAVRQCP